MPKKRKLARRTPKPAASARRQRPVRPRGWSRLLPGLVAAAVFLALAVLLTLPEAPPPQAPPARPAPTPMVEQLRPLVEDLLATQGVTSDQVSQHPSVGVIDLDVVALFPSPERLASLRRDLSALAGDAVTLEVLASRDELRLFEGVALVARLRYHPPEIVTQGGPRVAIIIDDLGRDLQTVRRLLDLQAPLTFAFLPGTARPADGARLVHEAGHEVLVHIPMEPQGYPAINPGADALLTGQSRDEIRARLTAHFERVPFARGANNHMGSRFTEYRDGMRAVVGFLKDRGAFFVDSATSGGTIAEAVAREEGVPAARRDVFLDNVPEVEKVRDQIRHLQRLAEARGEAVGIGHPYPETLEALRQELPRLEREGVQVVPVSRLVHRD